MAQNVVPRAKHWMPEAVAKSAGVLERSVPVAVPRMRPKTPIEHEVLAMRVFLE